MLHLSSRNFLFYIQQINLLYRGTILIPTETNFTIAMRIDIKLCQIPQNMLRLTVLFHLRMLADILIPPTLNE